MTRGFRRLLFYISLVIFLVLSYVIVVFALGYKYDFTNNRLVKTGSIEIKTNVSATVYINDASMGRVSFINKAFSQTLLLPKTYSVRVQADGYYSWQKNVEVKAGQLANYPMVYLLPSKLPSQFIASTSFNNFSIKFEPNPGLVILTSGRKTETISLDNGAIASIVPTIKPSQSPNANSNNNNKKIESTDENKAMWFNNHEVWIQWLNDSDYQPFRKSGDTELITRFAQTINDAQWYKDSSHVVVSVGGILKFIEIDTRGEINSFDIIPITSPFYLDNRTSTIYFFEKNNLEKVNLE